MILTPSNQFQVAALVATGYLVLFGRLHRQAYDQRRLQMQSYERLSSYPYTFEFDQPISWDILQRSGLREMRCENNRNRYTLTCTSPTYIKLRDEEVREDFSFSFPRNEHTLEVRNESVHHVRPFDIEFERNDMTVKVNDWVGQPIYFERIN